MNNNIGLYVVRIQKYVKDTSGAGCPSFMSVFLLLITSYLV